MAYHNGSVIHKQVHSPSCIAHTASLYLLQSLKDFLGEAKLKEFINFCLHYIADLDIPIKRCVRFAHQCLYTNETLPSHTAAPSLSSAMAC